MDKQARYKICITEKHLDVFHHVNNAMYLTLYEEARWDLITAKGYGLETIQKTGLGPVVLEAKIRFLKELRLNDKIEILTKINSYQGKIGNLSQSILREGTLCSDAEFVFGLFNLHTRELVLPTPEWFQVLGL